MATKDQVYGLVSSHFSGDYRRFRAVVLQIVAEAEAKGHSLGPMLRKLLPAEGGDLPPLPREVSDIISRSAPNTTLDGLVLDAHTRAQLDEVLAEHMAADALAAAGLEPARKLLFVGPPGVGKTMAAGALAASLGLPLCVVPTHNLIRSHLGETGQRLQAVFDAMRGHPGAYFFDEVDALVTRRHADGGSESGGEIRRVLNSILVLLQDFRGPGIFVAATNLHGILDPAVFRRFDAVVSFPMPTGDEATELMHRQFAAAGLTVDPKVALAGVEDWGFSHADVVAIASHAAKRCVLNGETCVAAHRIVEAVEQRAYQSGLARQGPGPDP